MSGARSSALAGTRSVHRVRRDWLRPHPSRLDPRRPDAALVLATHDAAVADGEAGYTDPATGSTVFTAVTLAGRGTCCEQGCRHCPWVGADGESPDGLP